VFLSLIRISVFIALIAGLSFAAVYLADNGGTVRLIIANTEFNPGPAQLMIMVALALAAIWLFFRLLGLVFATIRFVTGDETAISRYFNRNRERKGFEALSQGLIALASGDARAAYKASARAEKLLGRPELTDLITAQAAERAGETARATASYKRLLGHPETRFAAVRGLLSQRLTAGDDDQALKLAEKAAEMRPASGEVQDILLHLQARRRDWAGARATLKRKFAANLLPREVYWRRDAVLSLGEAKALAMEDKVDPGHDLAIAANKQVPDLAPAAIAAAQAWIARGRPKNAGKALNVAWTRSPHPELAAAFAGLVTDETPEARLKRMAVLFKGTEEHPETRMAQAELLMAAGDFPEARRMLLPLTEGETEARVMTLMAALERAMGADEGIVRGWLAKAITAPRGKQWVCGACERVSAEWHPACPHCHAIDTLAWTQAKGSPEALPGANLTLPLLIGSSDES